jgi:Bacterial Ig-like domain (group 3)/WD40-like Beta Propeller Repeat
MKNRFRIRITSLLSTVFAAITISLFALPARAQEFSSWSVPVNLNSIVLSDGTHCPAIVVNSPSPDPNVNSTSPDANDTHPAISKNGLSLYFASTRPGPDTMGHTGQGDYDLWVTHRDSLDSCWGSPLNVESVNSQKQDFAPDLSPDGHWLYFHSARTNWVRADGVMVASCGGLDLYVSHRVDIGNDLGWGNPVNLGCNTINAPGFDQAGPTYFEDDAAGTHFLYYTQKPTPPAGTRNDSAWDIYVSTCTQDIDTCNTPNTWGPGVPVNALNSPVRDTRTAIRHDGLEMILSSGRTGSLGFENLWVSARPAVALDQGNWSTPEPINCDDKPGCSPWNAQGPLINSDAFDGGPALSWDGTELYFFRVNADSLNNAGCTEGVAQEPPVTPDTGPVCRDLYVSKRTYLTTTVLSSSVNPSVLGQSATFTAAVGSAADSPPTGTVTFSDGAMNLGTGTLASGDATFTTSSLSVGSHSITAQYSGDRISGVSSGSLTQTVEYGVCPLFDQTRSVKSGATFPIKLQLCDANGNDVSSSAVIVHATSVTAVSGYLGTPDAPGNANPDNDFRFDATLGSTGGYIFNLSTGGLASGTYSLQFTAGSDPVTHSVNFGVN